MFTNQTVDDFQPDTAEDPLNFFSDEKKSSNPTSKASTKPAANTTDSESEEERTNPMVAGFQDDLDSSDEDVIHEVHPVNVKIASANVVLSSDEEAEPKAEVLSDSESDEPHSIEALPTLEPFVVSTANQNSPTEEKPKADESEDENSSDDDDVVTQKPVILTAIEDLSDEGGAYPILWI